MFDWVLTLAPTRQGGGVGGRGGGVPQFLLALGRFWAGKGGREKSVVYSRWLRNTCAVVEGLKNPLPPGEIFFTCPVVSFRTRPALSLLTKTTFVTERISSLRHLLPC